MDLDAWFSIEDFWRSHWLLISLPYGPHSGYYLHRKESHQQTHCLHYQGKIKEISLCILNIKMWKEVIFIWGLAAVYWQWWPVGRMTLQDLIWLQPVSEKVSVVLKCENVVSFIIYWATSHIQTLLLLNDSIYNKLKIKMCSTQSWQLKDFF